MNTPQSQKHPLALQTHQSKTLNLSDISPKVEGYDDRNNKNADSRGEEDKESPVVPKGATATKATK